MFGFVCNCMIALIHKHVLLINNFPKYGIIMVPQIIAVGNVLKIKVKWQVCMSCKLHLVIFKMH
jgi:hypothetical protein